MHSIERVLYMDDWIARDSVLTPDFGVSQASHFSRLMKRNKQAQDHNVNSFR